MIVDTFWNKEYISYEQYMGTLKAKEIKTL